MTSNVPPAIRRDRHAERLELLGKIDGLTTELVAAVERVLRLEEIDHVKPEWQICAMFARRIRGRARHWRDEQRRRDKRENRDPR